MAENESAYFDVAADPDVEIGTMVHNPLYDDSHTDPADTDGDTGDYAEVRSFKRHGHGPAVERRRRRR